LLDIRGVVDTPLFFNYNTIVIYQNMDKERLKLIVKNLESLVNCLKEELQLDENKQELNYEEIAPYIQDYDEVFYDDE
jgi:hypothetical protein